MSKNVRNVRKLEVLLEGRVAEGEAQNWQVSNKVLVLVAVALLVLLSRHMNERADEGNGCKCQSLNCVSNVAGVGPLHLMQFECFPDFVGFESWRQLGQQLVVKETGRATCAVGGLLKRSCRSKGDEDIWTDLNVEVSQFSSGQDHNGQEP